MTSDSNTTPEGPMLATQERPIYAGSTHFGAIADLAASPHRGDSDDARGAARLVEIARLRTRGASYQQIADRLGYSDRNSPRRLLMRHLRQQVHESVGEMRAIENERLDAAVLTVTAVMVDAATEPVIRLRAADSLVRISARRAALNGLDASISPEVLQGMEDAFVQLSQLVLGEGTDIPWPECGLGV